MIVHCDACDRGTYTPAYDDGEEVYCQYCWPQYKARVEARNARYKALGHTGSDMCGCSMCALNFERGM